ncbi:hypothetical protein N9L68_02275 [bacterium]|nr:hypothetical protein [bacterium]
MVLRSRIHCGSTHWNIERLRCHGVLHGYPPGTGGGGIWRAAGVPAAEKRRLVWHAVVASRRGTVPEPHGGGLAYRGEGGSDYIRIVETASRLVNAAAGTSGHVGTAVRWLKGQGQPDLAARLWRASRVRNGQAHPPGPLLEDIDACLRGRAASEDSGADESVASTTNSASAGSTALGSLVSHWGPRSSPPRRWTPSTRR